MLFAQNPGDMTRKVSSDTDLNPVFWSAVSAGSTFIVKLANYGAEQQSLTVNINGKASATLSILANDNPDSANTDTSSPIKAPTVSRIETGNNNFTFTLPPWSIAVLRTD